MEQLQLALLQGRKLDVRSKETTVLHRIFGGHLQQQIICSHCRKSSNTYEATLVLSVDCCNTIEQSLSRLTSVDSLQGKNRYKCEHCKALHEARKQTTIYNAPNTLVIHFKRFQFASKSSKISRPVTIGKTLDISRFMSKGRSSSLYSLVGLVTHEGSGVSSGHYYAFGKGSSDVWHEFNDSTVSQVGVDRVLRQQTYMLFYVKDAPSADQKIQNDSFEQLTGLNSLKRSNSGKHHGKHKKHRIFSQMKGSQ